MSDEQIVVCRTHLEVDPCPHYPVGCVMTQESLYVDMVQQKFNGKKIGDYR